MVDSRHTRRAQSTDAHAELIVDRKYGIPELSHYYPISKGPLIQT